ncbi:MAG: MarR family winged helix-turn-helix transcriptional regulator [Rhizobiaceae bacterium]
MKTDETDRLGLLVHDAARLMRRRFEARAAGTGLSAAQWRLMVKVAKEEGIAQARLAELLEIEPISVSRLIDRMEEGGWIERRFDPADRRVRTIHPTDRAREAYGRVKAMAGEVYEAALAGLDAAARRALIDGLKAVVANLSDADVADIAVPSAMQKAS